MGQSGSSAAAALRHPNPPPESPPSSQPSDPDHISNLPDACLAHIFQTLASAADRNRCSLVCRRWLAVDGQYRHRLSLKANSDLGSAVPSLFSRFDAVTKLSLKCDRNSVSINDEVLATISLKCRNLLRLKMRGCREVTDDGIAVFARNCRNLRKFSCGSCSFGTRGLDALVESCVNLEELSVKRMRGVNDGNVPIGEGLGLRTTRIKCIGLKDLYNGQCFGPLMVRSKELRALKVFRCAGDWDKLLEMVAESVKGLSEVHLERLQVSDYGLNAISKCESLEILHILKTPECSNLGLISVAENCKLLRKLHIDGWKTNMISDEGLIGVAKYCTKLQELVLIGVNPTCASLERLATNCLSLERLALCGSDSVGDKEMSCIAEKCKALKKLCIKSCAVSDHGMEALAGGCPNLVKVKVKKCRGVTAVGIGWLRASRELLTVNLDANEFENQDPSASDSAEEVGSENPPVAGPVEGGTSGASTSTARSASFKARLGRVTGKSLVARTLRRWSSFTGSSRSSH